MQFSHLNQQLSNITQPAKLQTFMLCQPQKKKNSLLLINTYPKINWELIEHS